MEMRRPDIRRAALVFVQGADCLFRCDGGGFADETAGRFTARPAVCIGVRKKGELLISHRYDRIPLLDSSPGGFYGSWSYETHPGTKVGKFYIFAKNFMRCVEKSFFI